MMGILDIQVINEVIKEWDALIVKTTNKQTQKPIWLEIYIKSFACVCL